MKFIFALTNTNHKIHFLKNWEKKTRFKKKTPIDFLNGKNNNEAWSKQLGQFWDTIMDLRI